MFRNPLTETTRFLHTPSDFAKSTLFYVQEAGRLKSLKAHTSRREHLDSFLFLIVLSGSGTLHYEGKSSRLIPGDCALIDCKNSYAHESSDTDPWELMWIHFNGPMAQNYYNYYHAMIPGNLFQAGSASDFTSIIEHLIDMDAGKNTWDEITASKCINDILTLCFTVPKLQEQVRDENIAQKLTAAKEYIDTHFAQKVSLDELSDLVFISKYHLSREFKNRYGITIGNYTLSKRMTLAKEMLRFTNQSIEAIALASGIPDTSYFNKVFKKSEGMTASEYRRKW